MSDSACTIPDIPFPPEYLEDLKRLGPILIESMERDGLPTESGSIDLGSLDSRLDLAYFFFMWVAECNDVIQNLNLTLNDLRSLPRTFSVLGGSPWTRYKLLVRVFFHEFYRVREIFNTVMSACVKRGFMSKDELPAVREAFHAAIQGTIELRNSLVHGSPTWRGGAHFDLNLASMAHDMGKRLVYQETGAEFGVEAALEQACSKILASLQKEGKNVSTIMNTFVRVSVNVSVRINGEV